MRTLAITAFYILIGNASLFSGENNYENELFINNSFSNNLIAQNGSENNLNNSAQDNSDTDKNTIIDTNQGNIDAGAYDKKETKSDIEPKLNDISNTNDAESRLEKKENTGANKNIINDNRNINPNIENIRPSGILEIDDPDLREQRIPGIVIKREKKEIENIEELKIASESKDLSASDKGKDSEKGSFSILIWIVLFCLIVGIIILFKFRSKSHSSDKVVRRFPGA